MAHWRTKSRLNNQTKEDAGWCLKRAPKGIAGPIRLRYTMYVKGTHRNDPDNFVSKYVTDSLVKLGVISDDNWQVVPEVSHRVQVSKSPTKREYTRLQIIRDEGDSD